METTNHPEPAWILKRSSHDTASKKNMKKGRCLLPQSFNKLCLAARPFHERTHSVSQHTTSKEKRLPKQSFSP